MLWFFIVQAVFVVILWEMGTSDKYPELAAPLLLIYMAVTGPIFLQNVEFKRKWNQLEKRRLKAVKDRREPNPVLPTQRKNYPSRFKGAARLHAPDRWGTTEGDGGRRPMSNVLTAALSYQQRGFSVIPIQPSEKKPLVHWEEYQSGRVTESEINAWWAKSPDANVGIVTGTVSGLVVIDLDTPEAKEKLKELVPGFDFTTVPRSRTGKGWQLFFQHPGITIRNRAGVIPGLDVRGDGGYVVAPPSIHPNGKAYKWEVPINGELPKLPVELLKLISYSTSNDQPGYRERFNTVGALAGVPEGQRDETLFKLACRLRSADVPKD